MKSSSLKTVIIRTIVCLGILCCIIGTVLYVFFPKIIRTKIEENLILKEGTTIFNSWISPVVPVYMRFYLFNVTNPDKVTNSGSTPILKEMGPYTYREYKVKKVVGWDQKASTVTYREVNTFYFEKELSVGDEDDVITAVNMPMLEIVKLAGNRIPYLLKPVLMPLVDGVLNGFNEKLFIQRSVKELLFGGYRVNILEQLSSIIKPFVPDLPEFLPNNTFGLLYGRNGSDDGLMTVYTGSDDITNYLHFYSWNNKKKLTFWKDKYCDMINGTDGKAFPPFISRNDVLYVFAPDICRSLPIAYEKDVVINGISAFRYTLPMTALQDINSNPDNQCYAEGRDMKDVSGLMPIGVCQKDRPVYASSPHFYFVDGRISSRVEGLNPQKEKHQTFIDIEPMIGAAINAAKRMQLNFEVRRNRWIYYLRDTIDMLLPVMWLEETATITEEAANLYHSQVSTPILIGNSVLISMMAVGVVWILIALVIMFWNFWKKSRPAKNKVGDVTPNQMSEVSTKTKEVMRY